MQGLVPLLTASLSDHKGRRPVLLVSLVLYIGVNIGLALQTSYPALFVLRCFQSFGSSGCAVIATGIVADLVPRHERGKYMAYASMGVSLGPSLGPVLGGVITHLAGWRGIFWFLVIWAGTMELVILTTLSETCRAVVGNGSVPPPRWNRTLYQTLVHKFDQPPDHSTVARFQRRPTVFDGVRLALDKEVGLLVLFGTVTFCGSIFVLSTLPTLLERTYGFNALQIGLSYLPYSCGAIAVRWTAGWLSDYNFRRHALRAGVEIVRNQQARLADIPLEKARLQITLPFAYAACAFMTVYAWLIKNEVHIAGPLVAMLFLGNTTGGTNSTLTSLLIDIHSKRPATVISSLNLFRFLCGAGIVAAAMPLIEVVGIGWVGTIVGLTLILASPSLWVVYFKGHDWRKGKDREQRA